MKADDHTILIILQFDLFLFKNAKIFKYRKVIVLGNKSLSDAFVTVQVSLQSSKHIFYFKAILSFEIKCIGKRRDYFVISWKSKNDGLCKMREINVLIVGQFEQAIIYFLVFPDVVPKEDLLVEVYFAIIRQQIATIMQIIEILLHIFQLMRVQNAIFVKIQEILQVNLAIFICIISKEKIAYSVVVYWTICNSHSSNIVGALILCHVSIYCKTIENLCEDDFSPLAQLAIDNHWFDFAPALRKLNSIQHLTIQLELFKCKTMIFDDIKVMNFKTNI